MNNVRRRKLEKIKKQLEEVIFEEQEAFDNLPDSLQYGERGGLMEDALLSMETAKDELEEVL